MRAATLLSGIVHSQLSWWFGFGLGFGRRFVGFALGISDPLVGIWNHRTNGREARGPSWRSWSCPRDGTPKRAIAAPRRHGYHFHPRTLGSMQTMRGVHMKMPFAVLFAASLLISLTSVHAQAIYPTHRCHLYDTPFIRITGQCGDQFLGVWAYPRRLFLHSSRRVHCYCSRRY